MIVPASFLFRIAHPCHFVKKLPQERGDRLLDLPETCRLDFVGAMDGRQPFADVRCAWNELGLAVQVEVRGKDQLPQGDAAQVRGSDGLTLWIDTRDSRSSHRASRYCHQFHFLPTGGGSNHDEPLATQARIHRALQDAPLAAADCISFRSRILKSGYVLETFLSAPLLHGFDPEQNARLGFFYVVRDLELGEQLPGLGPEFPYWEDPSLWNVLELVR